MLLAAPAAVYIDNDLMVAEFQRGVLRRWRGFRRGLALGLRGVRRWTSVREEGNLFVRRKGGGRVGGRTKAVDPRDVRVSQKQERQRYGKPIRHKQCKPRPAGAHVPYSTMPRSC